jgi:hypothetical protein
LNPGIFLIQDNQELVEMTEQPYESESLLQTLLAKYPALLVGNQIDAKAPRKWLFIQRECGIPDEEGASDRWKIDHLFLDQDAIPTLVEVKRSSDTRIRREVVGQMLDYAANASRHWPASHMRERFAAKCQRDGLDPAEVVADFVDDEEGIEVFWENADRNIKDGKIRLLFVADEIPQELQRIVEFLNSQMDRTEVLAIEVKQFVGQRAKGLVPRVIGQTAEAQQRKSPGARSTTTEEEFFERLGRRSPKDAEVARQILDWARDKSRVEWKSSSFVPVFEYGSAFTHNPITVRSSGRIEIKFKRMRNRNGLSEEKRLQLLRRLNEIPGIDLTPDSIDRFPRIELSSLATDGMREQFLNAILWSLEEVKKSHTPEIN